MEPIIAISTGCGHAVQKREVMCMDQIIFFLTEYAVWIEGAWYFFATILLLVTLHRIRQVKKLIQKMNGNDFSLTTVEVEQSGMEAEKKTAKDSVAEMEPEQVSQQNSQALIDAVLEEVFS